MAAEKRKPFTPEERQAYVEQQKQRQEELEARVKDMVSSFRDSDTFKEYLSKMGEFHRLCGKHLHHYSPTNLLFIIMQDPTASLVGSFGAWRKIGRHIPKGTTSHISVWAPVTTAVMQDKLDANGEPVLGPDGKPEREPMRDENGRVVRRFNGHFTLRPVYDVSQTEGEPLPELAPELKNPVEHFEEYAQAFREVSPLPIYMSDEPEAAKIQLGAAKGCCSFGERMIVVKAGMGQEHTLKTMVHEITHAMVHDPTRGAAVPSGKAQAAGKDGARKAPQFTPNEREVQAECTAFMVCEHFGLDTSDYSMPYIMSWSEDEKLTTLTNSLQVILDTSDKIIDQAESILWKDMGIDKKLATQHDHAMLPAVFDPQMAVDPLRIIANPTVEALREKGFKVRYVAPSHEGEAPKLRMLQTVGACGVELNVNLVMGPSGYTVPDFAKEGFTEMTAYELVGGSSKPFFHDQGGNIVDHLRNLRANPTFQNLYTLKRADFTFSHDTGHVAAFTRPIHKGTVTIQVPMVGQGAERHLDFASHDLTALIRTEGGIHRIPHAYSVDRAVAQVNRLLSAAQELKSPQSRGSGIQMNVSESFGREQAPWEKLRKAERAKTRASPSPQVKKERSRSMER